MTQASGLKDNLNNQPSELDSLKEEASSVGEKAKDLGVKALGVSAKIVTTITITTAAVYAGVFILSYLNVGAIYGLLIMAGTALALSYLEMGVGHGVWNPIAFFKS